MSSMLPHQAERFREIREMYRPDPESLSHLGKITCLAISGPRCSGKNTILSRSGFEIVRGVTSRPVRTGETGGEYVFRPDTPEEYDVIIDELSSGKWLQFELGISGYVYGSYPEHYRGPVAITDNTPKGSMALHDIGFKDVRHGYVAVPYVMWKKRFMGTRALELSSTQITLSIAEAKESAEFALESDQFSFIPNADGEIDEAVYAAQSLGFSDYVDQDLSAQGRKMCEQFLRLLAWDYGEKLELL